MLGSRRHGRPPNPPLTAATANPNAAMAAAAVFKKRDQQQPTLSAAAAAAALRARPMTPTNVAEVQTKRTQRRSASVSSSGTAPDVRARPGLQRRGSSASMTERTFRSPSPGPRRPSTSDERQLAPGQEPPPPVPPLPKNVDTRGVKSDRGGQQHHKTQSLGMANPPFRVASQKLGQTGTPSWYTGAHVGDLSNVRTSDAAMASPPLSPPPRFSHPDDDDRPDSRNSSINFSYPSRARIGSPASPTGGFELPPTSPPPDHGRRRTPSVSSSVKGRPASTSAVESLVYDPNSRRMVPRVDVYASEQDLHGASGRSVRNKKSKQIPKTGSHLSQGTMGRTKTAPTAAAYAAAAHETIQQQQAEPVQAQVSSRDTHRQEMARVAQPSRGPIEERTQVSHHGAPHEEPTAYVRDEPNRGVSYKPATSDTSGETHRVPFTTHAAQHLASAQEPHAVDEEQRPAEPTSPVNLSDADDATSAPRDRWLPEGLRRQPSVVKEEPEPNSDDEEEYAGAGQTVSAALDAVPTRQKVYGAQTHQAQPRPIEASPTPVSKRRTVSLQPQAAINMQRERSLSSSPARTARFGGILGGLSVKHSPPARSVSPRKSALKHSSSPSRGASPDGNISEASSGFNRRDEGSIQRKKSVRVSFDDDNTTVVGQSPGQAVGDSPTTSSPQQNARRSWYSNIGRSKKQEFVPLDDDEIMKPRPVLPSFGSVRDKKPREAATGEEGRVLVRPTVEPVNSPSLSATPSLPASPELLPPVPHVSDELEQETRAMSTGAGGDYSVGVSQAESDKAKIAANTSRFREPLPPVVTSIEGSGYLSDSSTSSEEGNGAPLAETASPSEGERFSTPEPPVQKQEVADAALLAAKHVNVPIQATMSPEVNTQESSAAIPTISISQPTPQPRSPSSHYFVGVPGGFPEDDSDASPQELDGNPIGPVPETAIAPTDPVTPARQATFEPVSQSADAAQTSQTPSTVTATLAPVAEEDDDTGSSIYSDAPDHFTDSEEGFLSLDAVVEHSVGRRSKKQTVTEALDPDVSAVHRATSKPSEQEAHPQFPAQLSTATTAVGSQAGEPTQYDWEKAKAYWRSLTAERRAQLEREAVEDAGVEGDLEEGNEGTTKPKKKKSAERRTSGRKALAVHMAQQMMAAQQQKQKQDDASVPAKTAPVAKVHNSERTYQIKPGSKFGSENKTPVSPVNADEVPSSPTRTTDAAPKFRRSMRTNGSISKAPEPDQSRRTTMSGKTLRSGSSSQHMSQAQNSRAPRRVSSPPLPTGAASAAMNTARNSALSSPPRRRDSTDSESSFRRARTEPSQGFGFRKSLRQASQSPAPRRELAGRPASSRFSLRSLSPTGSHSHFNHASPPSSMSMRASLRGSAKESKSTGGGGLHFGGFGKGSGKGSGKGATKANSRSSRFGDSSDEDEPRAGKFRSRFDDSSDEDEVRPLPALSQSMPRTMRSDKRAEAADWTKPTVRRYPPPKDSPALREEKEESEDEDPYIDEEKRVTASAPQSKTLRSGQGDVVGSPTATAPPRPPLDGGGKSPSSRRGSFMSVLRRKKNKTSGGIARPERVDSAARRDTKLERSAGELENIRRSGDMDRDMEEPEPTRPLSPRRLSKRTHSMLLDAVVSPGSGNWPLPTPIDQEQRPGTSGNLGTRTMSNTNDRPAPRRSMSANLLGVEGSVAGGEKKKKKFGALRKMFGLDD